MYLAKVDATDLNKGKWVKRIGSTTTNEFGRAIAVMPDTTVYVAGEIAGTVSFKSTNYTSTRTDIGLAKYDTAGTELAFIHTVGDSLDFPRDIAAFGTKSLYMTGTYGGTILYASANRCRFGTKTLTSLGAGDMFISRLINCTAPTAPTYTFNGKTNFCEGDSVKFSSTLNSSNKYVWTRDDYHITWANDSVFYAKLSGNHSIRVISPQGCYKDAATQTSISVNPKPVAAQVLSAKGVCEGDSISISATFSSSYKYQWYENGTIMAGATGQKIVVKKKGSYYVVITDGIGCTAKGKADSALFYAAPKGITLSSAKKLAFCIGDSIILVSSSAGTANFVHEWFKDNNQIIGGSNGNLVVKASGNYKVKVTNGFGCIFTTRDTVASASPKPTITIGATPKNVVCLGDSAKLTASQNNAFKYQWYKNDTILNTAKSNIYMAKSTGTFKVRVDNGQGCEVETSIPVRVANANKPTIKLVGNVFTSTTAKNYQWMMAATKVGTDNISYTATKDGYYKVMITDSNGCKNTSDSVQYLTTFITDVNGMPVAIKMYPNPTAKTNGYINVEGLLPASTIAIIDAQGRTVHQRTNQYTTERINITQLPAGVYQMLIKTVNSANPITTKFVITD
jgi:uncharacterized protein (DUF2345 family)